MQVLTAITIIVIGVSFFMDRRKTWLGIKTGIIMFGKILPIVLVIIILISTLLHFLPNPIIARYLGKDAGSLSYIIAALIGAVALIPSFIAYPLADMLVKNGVSYPVIAIFITNLMMVGILSLPLEAKYFGFKVAVLRNLLYFIGAIIIGLIIGLII